jgi:hypothetical protein
MAEQLGLHMLPRLLVVVDRLAVVQPLLDQHVAHRPQLDLALGPGPEPGQGGAVAGGIDGRGVAALDAGPHLGVGLDDAVGDVVVSLDGIDPEILPGDQDGEVGDFRAGHD